MRLNASRAAQSDLSSAFDFFGPPVRGQDRQDRLIPMINIVFLLLTFFLVAGTFHAADTLAIDPPLMRTGGVLDANKTTLYLERDGALAFGGLPMTQTKLVATVRDWLAKDPDGELQIKADKAVQAGTILPLLQELKQAGLKNVRLIVVKRDVGQ
ncbi:hypothetical protein MnTg02_00981 [bacterium MnTg02]|nr:hypothetical protein MnTg02_00981 [bacterium MnTg02]